MAFDAHANLAYTLVAIAPSPASSGTSLTVADGSVFPAAPFNATVWAIGEFPLLTNATIVRVTSVIGNVVNFSRQAEGSPNRSILVGDQIAATITVKTIVDLETSIPSTAGLLSAINVSAGVTSNNLSALTFDNSNGVSFGLTNGVITGTVATNYQSPGNYLTTAALSQDSSKYAGTNGAITGGSITVNTAGVSVNLPAYLTTAMASNRGSDFVAATAAFAGTNASGTIASNGISISVSAPGATASSWTVSDNATSGTVARLAFTNLNGVTLSLSSGTGGLHTIVGSHNGLTTAMASDAGTRFVQATAGFNGTNASGTIASDSISISVAAPIPIGTAVNDVASANSTGTVTRYAPEDHRHAGIGAIGISTSGNTAGTTKSVQGTYWFQGGNNITVSQITSNNGSHTLVLSGANAAGAQTAISGIIVSDATYTSGTVSFSNQGNITIGSSVNGATQFIRLSVAAQSNQSAIKGFGVSNTGNTAGNTGISSGIDWVLAASNSLTLSQSTAVGGPNTVWVQVGAYLTTAMASGASTQFVQANANFNGTNASGTIASNAISVSVAAPIPIATAVNDVASANSTGTVTRYAPEDHRHAGIGAIGISTSGNTAGTTKSVQGTYWFQGGNSITVSQITSNNGSHTLVLSAGNYITTGALSGDTTKYVQAWELTGNTAGTTSSLQGTKLYFEGGNSITVSGNSNTIKLSVGAYLTTAMASNRGTDFVQATAGFNGTNASGTIASNSISVSVAAPIPIGTSVNAVASASSVGTVTRYAPEDHRHAGIGAIGISTSGNTAGTTGSVVGTYWFQGGANLTVSQITSNNGSHTLVLSAGSAAAAPVNFSAGTTSGNLGSVVFGDSNGVSWGLNGSTITATVSTYSTVGTATTGYSVASANSVGTVTRWAAEDHRHAGIGAIGISTGNTSGTSGSVLGSYWIAGSNGVTVSQITSNNGSHTLVIADPVMPFVGWLEPMSQSNTALFGPTAGSWYFVPFVAPGSMSGGRINFLQQNTSTAALFRDITASAYVSSSTGAQQQGYSFEKRAALYSQGVGSNSTRLESFWSNSFSWGWTKSVQVSVSQASNINISVSHTISYISEIGSDGNYTLNAFNSGRATSVANSTTASNWGDTIAVSLRNMLSNSVIYPIGLNTTISAGAYWLAVAFSTTRSNASTGTGIATALDFSYSSDVGISRLVLESAYRNWASTATTARSHIMPYGVYTGAANMAPPQFVAFSSDLSSIASAWVPYFNIQYQGITK